MKIINIMNFVRYCEPRREENYRPRLFEATKGQLELVNEMGVDNTFLLQYDALCDEHYVRLFKEQATDRTELGLWYEIVAPLTYACGMPYRSERGWMWDWHIIPGFSMAYTKDERRRMIDEAMRKFKEVFGYYPRTVASWVIDTYTYNYLAEHSDIDAVAVCRDETNTDAYTLLGGYFNQAYYPSKNNIFTPAQSDTLRVNVPVFRLLGPCPIYNYDHRFIDFAEPTVYTLETGTPLATNPDTVDWFYKTYFRNPDLGFSYSQIGQENSFCEWDLVTPLRMQIEKAMALGDVEFQKMGDTGRAFRKRFPGKTPATAVVATDNWDTADLQSVYYDCENYVVNIFRHGKETGIRAFYLFDERVEDIYNNTQCTTFDALYENLPLGDTVSWDPTGKENVGLVLDGNSVPFTAEETAPGELTVTFGNKSVVCRESGVTLVGIDRATYAPGTPKADIRPEERGLVYTYKGTEYALTVQGGTVRKTDSGFVFEGDNMTLVPTKK